MEVVNGQAIDLKMFMPGPHTFALSATDKAYNATSKAVTFTVTSTVSSLKTVLKNMYDSGLISAQAYNGLMVKLNAAEKAKDTNTCNNILGAFKNMVNAQTGKGISEEAAKLLLADAQWVIDHP